MWITMVYLSYFIFFIFLPCFDLFLFARYIKGYNVAPDWANKTWRDMCDSDYVKLKFPNIVVFNLMCLPIINLFTLIFLGGYVLSKQLEVIHKRNRQKRENTDTKSIKDVF